MRTHSSSNLPVVSPSNPSTSNPKRRNHRRSKQPFILEESPIDTMADERTMTELLRAPTEGYAEAIVVPSILAEKFELKHSLINMMTSDQFFRLEKDNPHDHICWFNKITSTIKYKDVSNSAIKLMLFPFSLAGAARRWLEKEPPRSIHTWEDLVFKFINEFSPPLRTTNPPDQDSLNSAAGGNLLERRTQDVLTIIENKSKVRSSRNKAVVSQVKSCYANSNSSSEIAKLTHAVNHQTSAVTTAMTATLKQFQATPPPASIKAVEEICVTCSGKDYAKTVKNQSKPGNIEHEIGNLHQKPDQRAFFYNNQANEAKCQRLKVQGPFLPFIQIQRKKEKGKSNHKDYYCKFFKCLAAAGSTFSELMDNIQGYVSVAVVNYNQGNSVYRPPCMANQIRPPGFAQPNVQNNQNRFSQPQGFNRGNNFNPEQSYQAPTQQNQVVPLNELKKVKRMNEANMKAMKTKINIVKNELRNEMKNLIQASMSNQTNEIKNMMASLFQINTASTSGSGSLPSNTIANPKGELKAITTRSGLVLDEPSIPTPPPFINLGENERLHINITLADALILMPKYQKMLKALLSNKEKLQELENTPLNENCSAVILKKLPEKLGDPGKFLTPCGFSELKCKALADLAGIARDVFVPVGKFTFLADFVIFDYESDPRVPFILGRPFLRTTRALIDVHGEEMILHDGDEILTLNMRHNTSSYSNQPQKESINLINVFNNSSEDFLEDLFLTNQPSGNPTFSSHPELTSPEVKDDNFDPEGDNVLPEKLLDLDSTKDLHPPLNVNQLSGSTTYSSSPNQLFEEFTDELALITFPLKYDDDLQFDVESDLKEIEFLHHQDIDSSLKDSIDQSNLANLADNFVVTMPEIFTDEHALDYSSPSIFDEYDDDFFEVESNTENVYDDPFDSKGEKIKESKLLIDELDLPCDFLPSEYDSFLSKDFSRVDALPSTNNENKVFNPCILIQENPFEIITPVVQDKKLATYNDSLVIKDCDPPLYELPFSKEVPRSNILLPFSSKNEKKKNQTRDSHFWKNSFFSHHRTTHQGYKIFKINQIFKSPMKIFLFNCAKNTHILAVPCLRFYPLDQSSIGELGQAK
uniref:Reverse transcriptase domain-containing protein n=1 Tax=Tanacetum cinerariifolium TaxID=118510 RepID=A0A6L2M606_TANCI|nr:hypothetical protein [Tanacetum cinerariifolium]